MVQQLGKMLKVDPKDGPARLKPIKSHPKGVLKINCQSQYISTPF